MFAWNSRHTYLVYGFLELKFIHNEYKPNFQCFVFNCGRIAVAQQFSQIPINQRVWSNCKLDASAHDNSCINSDFQ